jgi:DnaK suppressor protein
LEVQEVATKSSQIRARLEAEKKRLQNELTQLKSTGTMEDRREGSPFWKKEEEATETIEMEKRMALENRLNTLMAEVERAIQKFETGSYGICDSCGATIDPARMEALPQAILCVNCRQKAKYAKSQFPTN